MLRQKKKKGSNERTVQSSRKNTTKQQRDSQLIRCTVQNTVLTELVEYSRKIEEKMKAVLSEIKENVQGTNGDGKETGTQHTTVCTRRKKETSNQTRMKKQEFGKMRRGLGTSRTS